MQKGAVWGYAIAGVIAVGLVGNWLNPTSEAANPTTSDSSSLELPSGKLSPNPDASSPLPSEGSNLDGQDPAIAALEVDDLGEDTCVTYEVCTFVDVRVKSPDGCDPAEIFITLFNSDDEDYDEESVDLGKLKKGQTLSNVEVGTDDLDAEYVEYSGYNCSTN
ncbi:MAG: hypothetical protein RIS80_935 [Actinomycetota bacterium]